MYLWHRKIFCFWQDLLSSNSWRLTFAEWHVGYMCLKGNIYIYSDGLSAIEVSVKTTRMSSEAAAWCKTDLSSDLYIFYRSELVWMLSNGKQDAKDVGLVKVFNFNYVFHHQEAFSQLLAAVSEKAEGALLYLYSMTVVQRGLRFSSVPQARRRSSLFIFMPCARQVQVCQTRFWFSTKSWFCKKRETFDGKGWWGTLL